MEGNGTQPDALRPVLAGIVLGTAVAVFLVSTGAVSLLRKQVTIQVDGERRAIRTYRSTVGEVLEEARVTFAPQDVVTPPVGTRVKDGMEISVRHAIPVVILADGREVKVHTTAATVREILAHQNISLGPKDKVYPSLDAQPWAGARIRVVRIEEKILSMRLPIPYRTVQRPDPHLTVGTTRIVRSGEPGFKEKLILLTYVDGRLISQKELGERVVKDPIDRLILYGRRFPIASRGAFLGREYIEMLATAYYPGPKNFGGGVDEVTAIGLRAGRGVVAVDPRVIPLRTKLYIEGYGYAIAGDTGGRIKGLRIDLGFDTYRDAIRFGKRRVRVYILERPD
ncbi:MAG: ubiquitin-like domain-containing protein [Armatimonadota bacterium]|nr:ubiquitin-like domain-containing protein [Armatimonadota bacterium]